MLCRVLPCHVEGLGGVLGLIRARPCFLALQLTLRCGRVYVSASVSVSVCVSECV